MPTTIFTDTLTSDDNNNDGLSVRNVLAITGGAQTQIRVTFKASSSQGLHADHCSIGISTGTNANTTAIPTELLFSGASGFTIAANGLITSDFVNFAGFTAADKLVAILDVNAAGAGGLIDDLASTGNVNWFAVATASYNVAAPAGFASQATTNISVSLIETQAVGGAAAAPTGIAGFVENEW